MNPTSNHDPAEIARFDATAQRWWDPHGEFRPLHVLNPVRLAYVDEQASLPGKRVLDVGCGGGLLSEAMAQRGADVTGIDLAPADHRSGRVACAVERPSRTLLRESAETHALHAAGTFDIVTCMEMLEHVPDPRQRAHRTARARKAGRLRVRLDFEQELKSFALAIVGAEYVMKLLRAGDAHLRAFHPTVRACALGPDRGTDRRRHRRARVRRARRPRAARRTWT